jgi:hypothetical protein
VARLWTSGFELQSTAAGREWTTTAGAAGTIQSTVSRKDANGNGSQYAYKIAGLASGTRSALFYNGWSTANSTHHVRFYVRFDALPSAENCFAALTSVNITGNFEPRITIDNAGVVRGQDSLGNSLGTGPTLAADGTWHRIEITYVIATNNLFTLYVDGTKYIDAVIVNDTNAIGLVVGGNLLAEAQTTGTWYFDDIAINDNTGSQQNGLPGDAYMHFMVPAAAGDNAGGTIGGSSPAATVWQSIDEVPPDDGVTYVSLVTQSSSPTTGDIFDVLCSAAPSVSSVAVVQVGFRTQPASNAAMAVTARAKVQASGTVGESAAVSITGTSWVTNDDTLPAPYKLVMYTSPQTGSVFTQTELNNLQIGARSTDTTPNPRITTMWAYVEYTPAASAALDEDEGVQYEPVTGWW